MFFSKLPDFAINILIFANFQFFGRLLKLNPRVFQKWTKYYILVWHLGKGYIRVNKNSFVIGLLANCTKFTLKLCNYGQTVKKAHFAQNLCSNTQFVFNCSFILLKTRAGHIQIFFWYFNLMCSMLTIYFNLLPLNLQYFWY